MCVCIGKTVSLKKIQKERNVNVGVFLELLYFETKKEVKTVKF